MQDTSVFYPDTFLVGFPQETKISTPKQILETPNRHPPEFFDLDADSVLNEWMTCYRNYLARHQKLQQQS